MNLAGFPGGRNEEKAAFPILPFSALVIEFYSCLGLAQAEHQPCYKQWTKAICRPQKNHPSLVYVPLLRSHLDSHKA